MATMPERMAMFETELKAVRDDVTEVKTDVKNIGLKLDQVAINLAVKEAVESAAIKSRTSTGLWVRFFTERAISILALVAAAYSILKG